MEETGHYYTVYFTSLAVGFSAEIAYAHATIAQMPDEVGWLDAANLHADELLGISEFNLDGIDGGFFHRSYNRVLVPNFHRAKIEYSLHSLPDSNMEAEYQSSKFQLKVTKQLLEEQNPLSVEFCLTLHRLGDNFAHRIIGHEDKMYTILFDTPLSFSAPGFGLGHAVDKHDPDYPDLRPDLFYEYLKVLYDVLHKKLWDKRRIIPQWYHGEQKPISYLHLENIYRWIFEASKPPPIDESKWNHSSWDYESNILDKQTEIMFWYQEYRKNIIKNIRSRCEWDLGIKMDAYEPEKRDNQTFLEFVNAHEGPAKLMNLNSNTVKQAVNKIFEKTSPHPPNQ